MLITFEPFSLIGRPHGLPADLLATRWADRGWPSSAPLGGLWISASDLDWERARLRDGAYFRFPLPVASRGELRSMRRARLFFAAAFPRPAACFSAAIAAAEVEVEMVAVSSGFVAQTQAPPEDSGQEAGRTRPTRSTLPVRCHARCLRTEMMPPISRAWRAADIDGIDNDILAAPALPERIADDVAARVGAEALHGGDTVAEGPLRQPPAGRARATDTQAITASQVNLVEAGAHAAQGRHAHTNDPDRSRRTAGSAAINCATMCRTTEHAPAQVSVPLQRQPDAGGRGRDWPGRDRDGRQRVP